MYTGAKYDAGLDVVDIAKLVRADIKAAVKSGDLPKGTKVSVRTSRHAGGESLTATIQAVPGVKVMNPDRMNMEIANPHGHRTEKPYNEEGDRILAVVNGIVNAYNRDRSDTATDYWNVHFYDDVKFAASLMSAEFRAFRDAASAELGREVEARVRALGRPTRVAYLRVIDGG